jgi:hypothetical protein
VRPPATDDLNENVFAASSVIGFIRLSLPNQLFEGLIQ